MNKKKSRGPLLSLFAMLMPMLMSAQVEINGLWYNLITKIKQAEVISNPDGTKYTGDITIPAKVINNGIEYDVTSIGKAFSRCGNLTSIIIPEGVTSIEDNAFEYCSSLTAITIPSSVTSIGEEAFWVCRNLTAVYISSIEAWCNIEFSRNFSSPLELAKKLYLNGELVTELSLPENITSIKKSTFSGCSTLTSITLPEGIVSIGNYAFDGCSSLTYINSPKSVSNIGWGAFRGCSSLAAITVPEGVTSIEGSTFSGCTSLTTITIPSSVTNVGNEAFDNCTSLKAVVFEDGSETLSLGYNKVGYPGEGLFHDCPLESVYWGRNLCYNEDPYFGYSPIYCNYKLKTVTIGPNVKKIGTYDFYACPGLTSIHISDLESWCNIDFSSNPLNYAKKLFLNGELVTELSIPESVTSIGNHAFKGCSSLTAVTLPENITSIGNYAFSGCNNLTTINIPKDVMSIGRNAFAGCSSLASIAFPKGVTTIGDEAFNNCSRITAITIPEGVMTIGYATFEYCI